MAFLLGFFVVMTLALLAALAFVSYRFFQLKAVNAEVRAQIRILETRLADQAVQEETLRSAARAEFENLASKIMERETRQFQESSEKGLERLLVPLKERLKDFEKRVEETYQSEGRERHVLKAEVDRLIQLNERMADEAKNLTQALKGDSKVQGDWGELVLENILQASGLREGMEYLKQQTLLDDEGEKFRPDVIVQLPDDKQIIVDSKVSLTAYELYSRSEDPEERQRHLKAHLESLHNHISELSEKHYPKLKGLKTPEFVFLFTPIEPAYLLAMRHDPEMATKAWNKGVAIVTSTTLLTSLKTVASIWKLEHQNRNAQEIAQEAARLYDKFVGFYEDFEKIGRTFESGLAQYEEARKKLRDGSGNVFRKIELLRELGAAPNKKLKPELLE
jgi:DNA recombination protein RmuC